MTHKWIAGLVGLSGLLLLSCNENSQANTGRPRTVRAATTVVQLTPLKEEIEAPGTVRAKTSTILSSRITGQVLSLSARPGDRVRQGQLLAEIDALEIAVRQQRAEAAVSESRRGLDEAERMIEAAEAGLRAAQAGEDLALATQKRFQLLRERNSVSAQEFDEVQARAKTAAAESERSRQALAAANARRLQAVARIEQAEAEAHSATIAVGYSRLTSPIAGIVTARHTEPGVLVMPGMPLLTIEDDATGEVEVALEESRAARIAVGAKARIEFDALPGTTLESRVREIVPVADPATRAFTIRLSLESSPQRAGIRSGMFARAFFATGERQALRIPATAVVQRGQLEGVYIVENGSALLRLVKTGKRRGAEVEVLSGLAPGTKIVIAPPAGVADGVVIVEVGAADGATAGPKVTP